MLGSARLRGATCDVFSAVDKRDKLTLLPGRTGQPVVDTSYYVHTTVPKGPLSDCPYHEGCHRERLSAYYER